MSGSPSPYVVIEHIGKENMRFQTPVVRQSFAPLWDFACEIDRFEVGDTLQFTLMDSKSWPRSDKVLGKALLTRNHINSDNCKLELTLDECATNARLFLAVVAHNVAGQEQAGEKRSTNLGLEVANSSLQLQVDGAVVKGNMLDNINHAPEGTVASAGPCSSAAVSKDSPAVHPLPCHVTAVDGWNGNLKVDRINHSPGVAASTYPYSPAAVSQGSPANSPLQVVGTGNQGRQVLAPGAQPPIVYTYTKSVHAPTRSVHAPTGSAHAPTRSVHAPAGNVQAPTAPTYTRKVHAPVTVSAAEFARVRTGPVAVVSKEATGTLAVSGTGAVQFPQLPKQAQVALPRFSPSRSR